VELKYPFRPLAAVGSIGIDIALPVVLFILLQVWAGIFPGTPINDDWAYARILEEFVRTGRFIPLGFIGMNQFTQTLMAYPFVKVFGSGWGTLHLFTLVMGSGVLGLTLIWMRQLGASRAMAFAAALAWIANPVFFGLSGSFMTDVPFLFLLLLCLIFANRSIADEKAVGAFVLFILSIVAAMLLRQPALWLAIAYGVACFDRKKRWAGARLLIPMTCAVAAQLLFDHWLSRTGANLEMRRYLTTRVIDHAVRLWHGESLLWKWILLNLVDFSSYVPMLMIPLLPFWLYGVKKYWSDAKPAERYGILAVFAIGCLLVGFAGVPPFRSHNVIVPGGIGPLTLRDGIILQSPSLMNVAFSFWVVIWFLTAITSGAMFVVWAGNIRKGGAWRQPAFRMVIAFVLLYSVPFVLTDFIDRYTLPILLCLAAPLARVPSDWKKRKVSVLSWIWLAVWVIVAAIAAHDYQAWQHAKWQAAQDLLAKVLIQDRSMEALNSIAIISTVA
jgi:hypothetical protein